MKNQWKCLFVIGLLLLSMPSHAQLIDVGSVHYALSNKQTRLVFDVSASPKHRVFVQNTPTKQLIIDIKNAQLTQQNLVQPKADHPLFGKIYSIAKTKNNLRLAIDLKKPVTAKEFSLRSNNKNEHKLIIDLINKNPSLDINKSLANKINKETVVNKISKKSDESIDNQLPKKTDLANEEKTKLDNNKSIANEQIQQPAKKIDELENKPKFVPVVPQKPTNMLAAWTEKISKATGLHQISQMITNKHDKIVVAIDAGHGGEDPGAHGINGTEEKQVVFAIAKKLALLINSQPNMTAVMVRKGDYYIGLRKRMQIAREANANLFISIHADAFQDNTVKGSSVYVLSESGASSEAALWLAKSENASDLIGGVSLEDKEDVLATVLLDLSQSATEQASVDVANSVLKNFRTLGTLHRAEVQKAGFMVLKSPDIPSILVETAFISNPSEEENLLNTEYQSKMATAIFKGVQDYFKSNDPTVDTKVAAL